MKRVRVLSLATLFPRTGHEGFGRFVARQFDALAERGDIDLTVACLVPRRAANGEPRGYPVRYVRFASMPKIGARWNPRLIAHAVLPLARRLHAQQPFDVVDAQFFYPDGPAAARVAKALGLPLSIKARGSDIHYWGAQSFALKQMLVAADQAAGLLAVSAALKADMVALGMAGSKIAVHYTGLDHTIFRPTPRREARAAAAEIVPVDGPLLVSVGNLIPLKHHALVIEALLHLPGVRLAIAGNGIEEQRLRKIASDIGLAGRVVLVGSLPPERLAVLLSAADVMVLPSEREGLANVWVEALACGTPLVITEVGGAREVVASPSAGRLVERAASAIAAAISDLLANPIPQTEVAAHAARFSWDTNAAQLAAHYRQLAGR